MQTHDRVALNNLMSTGQNRPKLSHAVLNIAVKEKVRMRVLKENSRIIFASLKKKKYTGPLLLERESRWQTGLHKYYRIL